MTSDKFYKLIEDNGLTLHGDIEHFAALVIDCLTLDELREAMIESQHMVLVRSGVRIVDLQAHIENFDGEDMNREDIIRMAREAGFSEWAVGLSEMPSHFERFADLVASAEREACAKVCDETYYSVQAAEIIRVRGQA